MWQQKDGNLVRRIVSRHIAWLAFGCSLTLLLLANFATYTIDHHFACRGLPFVYERSHAVFHVFWCGHDDFFRPLVLAVDIAIAFVVSGLIGLFVSRFRRIRRTPRAMFLLAILLFAAADVYFIYFSDPRTPSAVTEFNYRHFYAPYFYYVMLGPSVVLTISGLIWSLVSARRRRSEPLAVAQ